MGLLLVIFVAILVFLISLIQACVPDVPPPSGPLGGEGEGPGGYYGDPCKKERGAPVWHFDINSLNLVVKDTPIWIDSHYGPDIEFKLTYNILGKDNPGSTVGSRWTHNYGGYIAQDKDTGSIVLYDGSGRVDEYSKVGTNYILNQESIMSGEAAVMPRLTIDGDNIRAHYLDGSFKLYRKIESDNYRLISSTDNSGNTLSFAYKGSLLASVSNAANQAITLHYNSENKLTTVEGPTGYQAAFTYSTKGELISLTDMQGYTATVGYSEEGHLEYIQDAKGKTEFIVEPGDPETDRIESYPAPGDPMGLSSRLTIIDPVGNKSEYYYSSTTGNTWYVAPQDYIDYVDRNTNNGSVDVPKTIYSYKRYPKGYSRLQSVKYPDGQFVRYQYDDNRNLDKEEHSDGRVWSFRNNSLGNVIEQTDYLGNETICSRPIYHHSFYQIIHRPI